MTNIYGKLNEMQNESHTPLDYHNTSLQYSQLFSEND